MSNDTENIAFGTVTSEAFPAPFTFVAGNIDFADDTAAYESRVVGRHDFTYELVTGCTGKSVVPALEFEICIANSPQHQTN